MTARRNSWNRWGRADRAGALNLIDAQAVVKAARLVEVGRVVSMSRAIDPPDGVRIAATEVRRYDQYPRAGAVVETYEVTVHGHELTHLDALKHVWEDERMWNGRSAAQALAEDPTWGDVVTPAQGIVARGVLVDVVASRNAVPVTEGNPVTGAELESVVTSMEVSPEPGDVLVVRAGRREWEQRYGPYGSGPSRPGLAPSCLEFIRQTDCSVFVSDLLDHKPNPIDRQWGVHAALSELGVHLVDNAELTKLAGVAAELGRDDFLTVIAPWPLRGGSGSPVNPLAIF